MAWTTPKTWSSEPLIANDLNTHLRDNLDALKEPPQGGTNIDSPSDYSTSSTSFVDVDATDFSTTIVTNGGDVLVTLCVSVEGNNNYIYFDIDVDGTRQGGNDGILRKHCDGTFTHTVMFYYWVKGLSAASHTIKLQWKVTTSIGKIMGGATSLREVNGQWDVREVS